jgi:hypothetical protein
MLAARHPWLTIRVDQRVEYFRALRRAQIDEEYTDFARFITDSAKQLEALTD